MAERQRHQLLNDCYRILRAFGKAYTYNVIHSLRVAFIAYVVTVLASGLAVLFFVADGAFHQLVIF